MPFHLQSHIDSLYKTSYRRMAFQAGDKEEMPAWRHKLRAELASALGIAGRELPDAPKVQKLSSTEYDNYSEEKYALDVDGVPAPMYLLIPKTPPPYKAILAMHGHVPGIDYLLGRYPTEDIARERLALDENYAQKLAQDGYLVCAVEQRGFGERRTDQINEMASENSCRHLAFEYLMRGQVLMGERVWDGMVAISYLQTRQDVIPGILGCTGHSGGGASSFFLTALDERVTTAVIASYYCAFRQSILGMRHCECNYIPNILALADAGDIGALMAPRAVCYLTGEDDPIFPIDGVREVYPVTQSAYHTLDAEDQCSLVVYPGGHRYDYAAAHTWFRQWL